MDESADEIHGDEGIDFRKREERITKLRTDALQEVRESLVRAIFDEAKREFVSGALLKSCLTRVALLAHFRRGTWKFVDTLGGDAALARLRASIKPETARAASASKTSRSMCAGSNPGSHSDQAIATSRKRRRDARSDRRASPFAPA